MGKKKKQRVIKKLKPAKEGSNPFEMRINNQKHNILGRKTKNDRGMPGISRNKAIKKRKETLLQEYKMKNKSNSYVDRRFGEHEEGNPEDKAAVRFAIERKKSKTNMYNLNDDEDLTHLGRRIGEMDKFDNPLSDSEDDERLEGDVVKKAHFGGGILTKKDAEESERSHKAIMEEIIADRIQRKHERQKVKEDNMDLTDKLDGTWKDIQKLMVSLKQSKTRDEKEEKPKQDDYDIKVQELKFEAKGKASDKLKTDEEIAYEEKQKLEKLELERLERMSGGNSISKTKSKHISADGLGDDFELYSEGKNQKSEFLPSKRLRDPMGLDILNEDDDEEEKSEDESVEYDGNDDSSNEDSDDSFADVLTDDEATEKIEDNDASCSERILISKNDQSNTIPYVIDCPVSFDDFFKLLFNRSVIEISTIIERIIKCNHPSLSSDNKGKLENLFAFLLQFIDEICISDEVEFQAVDILSVNIQNLLELSPLAMSKLLLNVIGEKRDEFLVRNKGKEKNFPGLSTLIYLKLVSMLYPTSDYRHPIVTPAMVFMSEIMLVSKIGTPIDIAKGLYVCSLFYEYVSVSKRLVPEVINYLDKVLCIFEKKENLGSLNVSNLDYNNLKPNNSRFSLKMFKSEEYIKNNDLVSHILTMTLSLIKRFSILYKDVPSYVELFKFMKHSLTSLPMKYFQPEIKSIISLLSEFPTKTFIKSENRRPPALKLYEPRIQENFDGKKKHHGSQKKLEQQKIVHKYKREMKGAMREIRRDNHFIANEKLNEEMSKDAERKEKLKRLYHDLASQEGDFKKMKKSS